MECLLMFWKLPPWLSRLTIPAVALLFTMISLKFVLDIWMETRRRALHPVES
jgi:hypothetical protein